MGSGKKEHEKGERKIPPFDSEQPAPEHGEQAAPSAPRFDETPTDEVVKTENSAEQKTVDAEIIPSPPLESKVIEQASTLDAAQPAAPPEEGLKPGTYNMSSLEGSLEKLRETLEKLGNPDKNTVAEDPKKKTEETPVGVKTDKIVKKEVGLAAKTGTDEEAAEKLFDCSDVRIVNYRKKDIPPLTGKPAEKAYESAAKVTGASQPAQYSKHSPSRGTTGLTFGLGSVILGGALGLFGGYFLYKGDDQEQINQIQAVRTKLEARLKTENERYSAQLEKVTTSLGAVESQRDDYKTLGEKLGVDLRTAEKKRAEYETEIKRLRTDYDRERASNKIDLENRTKQLAEMEEAQTQTEPAVTTTSATFTQPSGARKTASPARERVSPESQQTFDLDYLLSNRITRFDAAQEAQIKRAQNYTAEMFGANVDALIRYNALMDGAQSHLEKGTWGTAKAQKELEEAYKGLQDIAPALMDRVDLQLEGMRRAFIKGVSPEQQQYVPHEKKRMRAS